MITITITASSDSDRLGEFKFFKDLIYVGSNHDADVYLPSDEVKNNHIFIEIIEEKLIVHLGRDIDHILVNGKRTSTFKKLKIGDVIGIGYTKLRVDSFEESKTLSTKELTKQRLASLENHNPQLFKVIKAYGDEV